MKLPQVLCKKIQDDKTIKEFLLHLEDNLTYMNKNAEPKSLIEFLEDYLCTVKQLEVVLKEPYEHNPPLKVGIRYDIEETPYTLPKNIVEMIECRSLKNSH